MCLIFIIVGIVPIMLIKHGILTNYQDQAVKQRISIIQSQSDLITAQISKTDYLSGEKSKITDVELQQMALEVGLESEDYEQERADAHDLAMIALDRKIDDDESARYNAIVQRMLRRAYLAEMALISGETAKEREN